MEEESLEERVNRTIIRLNSAVVGGAGGIGSTLAGKLAERGDKVIIIDKNEEGGRRVADGNNAAFYHGDFRAAADLERIARQIGQEYGHITNLAVVAGGVYEESEARPIQQVSYSDFLNSVRTNLVGPFLAIKYMLPLMIQRPHGQHGSIALAGSSNAEGGFGLYPYSAAKAGLVGLARSLVDELGEYGITINVVEIGGTKTSAFPEKLYPGVEARSPLKRMNDPEDVADAFVYLTTAKTVTGAVLQVNFGQTIARRLRE